MTGSDEVRAAVDRAHQAIRELIEAEEAEDEYDHGPLYEGPEEDPDVDEDVAEL